MFIQDAKDEDYRGVHSKARGQLGRISLVCHGLFFAVDKMLSPDDKKKLPREISNDTMEYAVCIMKLGIAHKCALRPPLTDTPINIGELDEAQDQPLPDNQPDDEYPMASLTVHERTPGTFVRCATADKCNKVPGCEAVMD